MEQYYFIFYCDELCVDLECELEYEEAESPFEAIPKILEQLRPLCS